MSSRDEATLARAYLGDDGDSLGQHRKWVPQKIEKREGSEGHVAAQRLGPYE